MRSIRPANSSSRLPSTRRLSPQMSLLRQPSSSGPRGRAPKSGRRSLNQRLAGRPPFFNHLNNLERKQDPWRLDRSCRAHRTCEARRVRSLRPLALLEQSGPAEIPASFRPWRCCWRTMHRPRTSKSPLPERVRHHVVNPLREFCRRSFCSGTRCTSCGVLIPSSQGV